MQAGIEGQLYISIQPDTAGVRIRSTRPLQAVNQLLRGKSIEQAVQLVPLLFNVCGTAQAYAALKAAHQAQQLPLRAEFKQACHDLVALETGREHVLRITMDWTKWAGLSIDSTVVNQAIRFLPQAKRAWFDKQSLANSQDAFADHSQRQALKQSWQDFLEQYVFALPLNTWRGFDLAALQHWIIHSESIAAQALKQLQDSGWGSLGANTLAPDQESSALTRQAQQPLMQSVLAVYGNGVFSRWVARLVELAWAKSDPLDHSVEAARGRLCHTIHFDTQGVTNYQIHAPTEINFSQGGVVEQGLQALLRVKRDNLNVQQQADVWIQAIDPCVSYQWEAWQDA